MSISSRSTIKKGLCFIKANFGSIWLMMLKVFVSFIPLMIIIGVSALSLMGGDLLTVIGRLYNISLMSKVLAGFGSVLSFLFAMLASSAMGVAMVRSILLDQPLDTRIFSKLFDRIVLKYFMALLLIAITIGLVLAAIIALGVMVHLSAFVLSLVVVYLGLRMALIPYGVAAGDINSLSDACEKTKGQIWNVIKVSVFALFIILLFQIVIQLLIYGSGLIGGTVSMILTGLIVLASLVLCLPLQQILLTSIAYLYKGIR